jgi:hypothetical protein
MRTLLSGGIAFHRSRSVSVLAITCCALIAGSTPGNAQVGAPGPAVCANLSAALPPPPAVTVPRVAEQLSHDQIQPGSALAQLVLANQDTRRLRAGEAKDGKPLPLWLRVYWLKAHPETRYVASDPTGGYPSTLQKLYRWMLHHQDLKAGQQPASQASPATGAAVAYEATASGQQRISGRQSVPVNDSDVRIDFYDSSKIIAAVDDPTGELGMVQILFSTDGGATWGRSILPFGSRDLYQSDGAVEWTEDGTAWVTAVVLAKVTPTFANFEMHAYKSTDSGRTWVFDALLSGSQDSAFRDRLWVDRGASSPYKDDIYALWNASAGVYASHRTHADGVWHGPLQVSDARTVQATEGAEAETNSAGDVFGFWGDGGSRQLFVAKSTDGGATFGAPVVLAHTFDQGSVWVPATASGVASTHVSGGAFKNGTENQVYAVWVDLSGEAGCTIWNEQPVFVVGGNSCTSRVWFARSTDGGATWSQPVKIHHQPTRNDQFMPVLAVDETSGKLAVTYYDTVGDPSRARTNLFYQSSTDGGTTWSDPLQVTTARTNETILGADETQYGDHNGLSVVNGSIVPTWTDRRNGGFEEVWSATIADPAPCTAPAVTGLTAASHPAGTDLTWDASPGATYRVFRAPASGGPYGLIATTVLNGYFDPAGTCGVANHYVVRAVAACTSALSNEVSVTGRSPSILYSNNFESGSGLADWTTGAVPNFVGAADWRGIESCSAHSGSKIFRFGGATCSSGAGPGDLAFAYPHGPNGIPIPAGTVGAQVSFWHRRDFQPGSGGLLAFAMSDLLDACFLVHSPFLSGESYNGTISSACAPPELLDQSLFTGTSDTFTQTTVDLDQAYSDLGIAGSPAGHVVEPLFVGFTDCNAAPQTGWFLDDVTVTACTPPPAPAYGFYTVTPCRLLDTRQPTGLAGGPQIGAQAARAMSLAGRCGIPPTAKALSVNVTVVQPAKSGQLILYPDDQAAPLATTINFAAGALRANNAILGLGNGSGGAIAQNQSAGGVDLVIDVNGYFQ